MSEPWRSIGARGSVSATEVAVLEAKTLYHAKAQRNSRRLEGLLSMFVGIRDGSGRVWASDLPKQYDPYIIGWRLYPMRRRVVADL